MPGVLMVEVRTDLPYRHPCVVQRSCLIAGSYRSLRFILLVLIAYVPYFLEV
uniref:Uncharacterized protein n=1 Tax=Arundo donax TaxID=35708 RepID=A0A0A9CZD7_ARUDO